jgi:hypothetical protein
MLLLTSMVSKVISGLVLMILFNSLTASMHRGHTLVL